MTQIKVQMFKMNVKTFIKILQNRSFGIVLKSF